ncbi:non-receptor serine/threonine protein kinase [Lithospermum erythrorhizon]|uniref:Non-receptor serine/threonine protein kinase n=1 Tax=Lithospermum erythrorhizon TaxID=34254 RepID=A0AAV3NRV3_LITER
MGCICATLATPTPPRNQERLKVGDEYDVGSKRGHHVHGTQGFKDGDKALIRQEHAKNLGAIGDNRITSEGEKQGVNVSRRITEKKTEADETMEGLPKWLIDNIPKSVLASLTTKTADSYDKIRKVGHGTYSNVYKARDRDTGKIVALKKVRFDTSEPESVKFMAREIILLMQLDHPNIIKLEGLATSRMQYSLYLVFEYMQSDLTRIIARPDGRLTEPQVKSYMQQLLSGLQHCHKKGILHRDIKGSNLLIDKNGMLKIADFGLANYYCLRPRRPLTSRVVTLWYRAPELLLGSTDYGVGIDLWSAGCLLAEMFIARPILAGRNEVEQLHKIFKLCGSPPEEYWKKLKSSTSFRPPNYKSSFKEVFQRLPDSTFGLLNQLLHLDPPHRGTAASALQDGFFSTSPLACDLSGLPMIKPEDDELVLTIDQKRRKALKAKKQSSRKHIRKLSDLVADNAPKDHESFKENKYAEDLSQRSYATTNSTSSTSSSLRQSKTRLNSPPSPIPGAFLSQQNRSAVTEAHPNALKNIKNYPLLMASIREAANHLQEHRLNINRKSLSAVDLRNLDAEKISKLLGFKEN